MCRASAGRWTLEDVVGGRRTVHAPQNVADPLCSAQLLHQLLELMLAPKIPEPPSVWQDALIPVIVPPLPPLRPYHPRIFLEIHLLQGVVILQTIRGQNPKQQHHEHPGTVLALTAMHQHVFAQRKGREHQPHSCAQALQPRDAVQDPLEIQVHPKPYTPVVPFVIALVRCVDDDGNVAAWGRKRYTINLHTFLCRPVGFHGWLPSCLALPAWVVQTCTYFSSRPAHCRASLQPPMNKRPGGVGSRLWTLGASTKRLNLSSATVVTASHLPQHVRELDVSRAEEWNPFLSKMIKSGGMRRDGREGGRACTWSRVSWRYRRAPRPLLGHSILPQGQPHVFEDTTWKLVLGVDVVALHPLHASQSRPIPNARHHRHTHWTQHAGRKTGQLIWATSSTLSLYLSLSLTLSLTPSLALSLSLSLPLPFPLCGCMDISMRFLSEI